MHRKLAVAALAGIFLAAPAAAVAGHGLELLDHPSVGIAPQTPPSPAFLSGGRGAKWEPIATFATGNPHTDLDFFTQKGNTYASVGTLGIGPNAGGQEIFQLTNGNTVAPRAVKAHPSASCLSDPSAATGLQHDVEAAPKGQADPQRGRPPGRPARRPDPARRHRCARPLPRPGRLRRGRPAAGRARDRRRDRREQPRRDRHDQPHRRGAHGERRPAPPAHRLRGHLRLDRRERRGPPHQRDPHERRRHQAEPRRVRGRGHVLVHELPGGHHDRGEARALPPAGLPLPLSEHADVARPHQQGHDLRLPRARDLPERPHDLRERPGDDPARPLRRVRQPRHHVELPRRQAARHPAEVQRAREHLGAAVHHRRDDHRLRRRHRARAPTTSTWRTGWPPAGRR